MIISEQTVKQVATLARIAINDEDTFAYTQDITNILSLMEQMNAVDTLGMEPLAHPLEVSQRLRQDVITEFNDRDALQKLTPHVERGLYLVPKVIED